MFSTVPVIVFMLNISRFHNRRQSFINQEVDQYFFFPNNENVNKKSLVKDFGICE